MIEIGPNLVNVLGSVLAVVVLAISVWAITRQ